MAHAVNIAALSGALLALSSGAALAANAVVTAPTSIHAAPSGNAAVIGTLRPMTTINATNCRKGWCATAGGYVRSGALRIARAAPPGWLTTKTSP